MREWWIGRQHWMIVQKQQPLYQDAAWQVLLVFDQPHFRTLYGILPPIAEYAFPSGISLCVWGTASHF